MGRNRYQKCDQNYDCLNCTHPDCIVGLPVVKKTTAEEDAKNIINGKYNRSLEAVNRKRQNTKKWRSVPENRTKLNECNKRWQREHPEEKKFISRKYTRIQALKNGKPKIVGTAMINGKETIIYRGKKKDDFWYMFGKEYGEIKHEDITWLWIEKLEA